MTTVDNALEYDVSLFILENEDALREKLSTIQKKHSELFPESLYAIYLSQYEDAAFDLIKKEVVQAFNLNPENSLRVTKDCVKLIASKLLLPYNKGE